MFVHAKENAVSALQRVFVQYSQELYTVKCSYAFLHPCVSTWIKKACNLGLKWVNRINTVELKCILSYLLGLL